MKFFEQIKKAIYNPHFYSGLSKSSMGTSLGYYLLLALGLSILQVIILFSLLFFSIPQQAKIYVTQAVNYYPSDLEIKINHGEATTSAKQPYFIPLAQDKKSQDINSLNNLVVIDMLTPYSQSQFDQYKTVAWLTKDTVFYRSNGDLIKNFSLPINKNFTINKSFVQDLGTRATAWINWVGPLLLILALIGFFTLYAFRIIQVLILALIIFLISKFFKWNLSYGASLKITFFAVTLGFLIEILAAIIARFIPFPGFPFMFTIITLGVVIANHYQSKKS